MWHLRDFSSDCLYQIHRRGWGGGFWKGDYLQNSHQNAGGVNPGTGGRTAGQHLGFKVGTAAWLCFSRVFQLCGCQGVGGGLDVTRVRGWQVSSKKGREGKGRWENARPSPCQVKEERQGS